MKLNLALKNKFESLLKAKIQENGARHLCIKCTKDGYYFPNGGQGDPDALVGNKKEDILMSLSKELETFNKDQQSRAPYGPTCFHSPTQPSLCSTECTKDDKR